MDETPLCTDGGGAEHACVHACVRLSECRGRAGRASGRAGVGGPEAHRAGGPSIGHVSSCTYVCRYVCMYGRDCMYGGYPQQPAGRGEGGADQRILEGFFFF